MNLIKFSNGKWGIRKGWIFHEYLHFTISKNNSWLGKDHLYFKDLCMVDEITARNKFYNFDEVKYIPITDEVIEP